MRALGLVRDLFFREKIDAVARASGAEVSYASTLAAAADRCADERPAIIFVDLSGASFAPDEAVAKFRLHAPAAKLVGFASHVDLKSLRAARDSGFDLVLSREEFTSRLPELLKG
jgi:DNA-binding NarL/FixJ family response regulator